MRILGVATFTLAALASINLNFKASAQVVAKPIIVNPSSGADVPIVQASDYITPANNAASANVSIIPVETKAKPQFAGYMGSVKKTPPTVVPSQNQVAIITIDVQIVGATPELEEVVRQTIRTRPGGDATPNQLNEDVAAILATGLFEEASVSSTTSRTGLKVVYQVRPIVVRAIALLGAQALSPAIADASFKSQLGTTASPAAIRQGVQQINQWYAQNNYVAARVLDVKPSRDGVITITVGEGVVGDVKFRFVDKEGKPAKGRTKESFLRQELQVKPGQPFRSDIAQRDIQNLYQLGLFDKAEVSLNGDSRKLDVTYELRERAARAANVGGGYNSDIGLFATFNYSDQNLGGVNQILNSNVQISRRDLQFNTKFTSPYRVSNPDRLGYTVNSFRNRKLSQVFDEDIRLANGDRVREGQFGGGIKFFRPVDGWQTSIGLNYARTSIRDSDGDIALVDAQNHPLSFSGTGIDDLVTVSAGVVKDVRDNTLNPTKGSILSFSTEQSIPVGLGSILLNRVQANYSQFLPVSILGSKQTEVLAFNLQGGTTIGDLPPYQAFNLGGINSVRGYETGDVASGRSFVLATAEYRFPIYKPVGGVLFADFGSDLGSSDTVPGEPGVVRGKPGTGFGYGAGLRVTSPIGLIRAEFGINDHGESRLQFGIGQRF